MSLKENISIDEVIEFLNVLLWKDRTAIENIVLNRVKCNDEIANHPTVQVGYFEDEYMVGFLGILNGLFGVDEDGYGCICAEFVNGRLVRFVKIDEYKQER